MSVTLLDLVGCLTIVHFPPAEMRSHLKVLGRGVM